MKKHDKWKKLTRLALLGGLVLLVVAIVVAGVTAFSERDPLSAPTPSNRRDTLATGVQSSVFKEIAKPIYLSPIKIQFKEKTLPIEEIGMEEGGFLGVPASWQTAGWYKEGAKPGEEGNVIIDGHYDTNTGSPGAFWELKNLQVGDKVLLTDKLGRVFEYSVDDKSYISISDPERSKVFASGKDKILTLITCGGVWDYASGTYNKRLVITAVFDKMEKSW